MNEQPVASMPARLAFLEALVTALYRHENLSLDLVNQVLQHAVHQDTSSEYILGLLYEEPEPEPVYQDCQCQDDEVAWYQDWYNPVTRDVVCILCGRVLD